MPLKFISFVLLSYITVNLVSGTAILPLDLDDATCRYKIYNVSEHDSVQVEWDGRQIPSSCKMSFIGHYVTGDVESHAVCVQVWKYDVNDCSFTMEFFRGRDSVQAEKEYSCYKELPPKFCVGDGEVLDIKFEAPSSSASYFTLTVTATATYKKDMTIVYVGVSIAAIVCVAVIGVLLFQVYQRRKQQQEQGMHVMLQESESS